MSEHRFKPAPSGFMTLGIDFDCTFTAAPEFWSYFIRLARDLGHSAVIVTQREGWGAWGDEVRAAIGDRCPIVFAGKRRKCDAAREEGFDVTVWVDDAPQGIGLPVPVVDGVPYDPTTAGDFPLSYEEWCDATGRAICPACRLVHSGVPSAYGACAEWAA